GAPQGRNHAVPNRQSDKIIVFSLEDDGTYWVEFRTADGRAHRAMLESGSRVLPPCLESVHSRPRAAQVVSDSCLIQISCSMNSNHPVRWYRDAKGESSHTP